MRSSLLYIGVCGSIVTAYLSYLYVPPEATMGDLYRILYIHLPVAWICYLAFIISLTCSILYQKKRDMKFDLLAGASAGLGLLFGAVTLLTGAIWAEAAWGTYWNWDPRETTTLILWIAYLGYITLRLSLANEERRAAVSAVYNILAFFTVPLSYFSLEILPTLHPQVMGGSGIGLTAPMILTLVAGVASATVLFVYFLSAVAAAGSMERRIDALRLRREEGGI